jgi:hypothetical protein
VFEVGCLSLMVGAQTTNLKQLRSNTQAATTNLKQPSSNTQALNTKLKQPSSNTQAQTTKLSLIVCAWFFELGCLSLVV